VTGRARYTDDLTIPGAWYGKAIRSTVPRGRIRSITFDPLFDSERVVVVTADDIPGDNVVHLIRDDQPILATRGGEVRHREEPILLLAAPIGAPSRRRRATSRSSMRSLNRFTRSRKRSRSSAP